MSIVPCWLPAPKALRRLTPKARGRLTPKARGRLTPKAPGRLTPSVAKRPTPPDGLRRGVARLVLAGAALLLAACAGVPKPPPLPPLPSASGATTDGCAAGWAAIDTAVARAGVADAEAERLDGLPGLRVDRRLVALADTARRDAAAWSAWLRHAAELDRSARDAEIANLPEAAFPLDPVGADPTRASLPDRAAARALATRCRDALLHRLEALPPDTATPMREAVLARARVPDRYATALRVVGLYPLVRWPFFAGVQAWQDAHAATMRRWAEAPPPGLVRHRVDGAGAVAGPPTEPLRRDALGLPMPTLEQARRLLAWHAPVFEIETRGDADRFGAPAWPAHDARAPRVDTAEPVVYTRIGHARVDGRWQLQLVYTLWFPERPARSRLDLLAGTLDGVIVRLTLADDGTPLLMDSIHACGCYHLFFPSAALEPRDGAPAHEEWLFAPAPLPSLGADARLLVRLASGTHYVSGLAAWPRAQDSADGDAHYRLDDEHTLRSLPPAGGAEAHRRADERVTSPAGREGTGPRRSLYGPDGLVAGSERGERMLFWPMGIASAGAMRQWGHHATAFVGRRHFDDADLIERRFVLRPDHAAEPSR